LAWKKNVEKKIARRNVVTDSREFEDFVPLCREGLKALPEKSAVELGRGQYHPR